MARDGGFSSFDASATLELSQLAELIGFEWLVGEGQIRLNERLSGVLGVSGFISLEEFLHRIHPRERAELKAHLSYQAAEARVEPSAMTVRIFKDDGAERWFQLRFLGSELNRENGRPAKVLASGYDVSLDKRASLEDETALERALRTVASTPGALYIRNHQPAWMFVELSEQFAQLCGHDPALLVSQRLAYLDLVHPDDLATVRGLVETHRQTGTFALRYRLRTVAGDYRWIQDRGRIETDPKTKRILSISGVLLDADDDVAREEQLKLVLAAISASKDCVIVTEAEPFDPPGPRIVYVNDAFAEMTGYRREEVLGRTPRILQGKGSSQGTLGQIRRQLEAWENVNVEVLNYKKDGTPFWAELSITPVADESGWYTHWVSVQRDITERKKQDHRLSLLESVVTKALDSVIVTEAEPFDEPGPRIVYVNEAFCRETGYAPEDVIGKTPRILQGPDSDPEALARIRTAMKGWNSVSVDVLNYRKNGTPYWSELSLTPIADETGRYTHWVSVQRNISLRKSEADLISLLESALDKAPDSVLLTKMVGDDPGRPEIAFVNKAFCEDMGYVPEEVVGKTPRMLHGPETDRARLAQIQAAFAARQPLDVEVLSYRKGGRPFWSEVSISPMGNATGSYAHCVLRDISARKGRIPYGRSAPVGANEDPDASSSSGRPGR